VFPPQSVVLASPLKKL